MTFREFLKENKITLKAAAEQLGLPVQSVKDYASGRRNPRIKRRRQIEQWSGGAVHRVDDWTRLSAVVSVATPPPRQAEELIERDPLEYTRIINELADNGLVATLDILHRQIAYLALAGQKEQLRPGEIQLLAGLIKSLGDTRKRIAELGDDKEQIGRLEVACTFLPDPFLCPHCGRKIRQDEILAGNDHEK